MTKALMRDEHGRRKDFFQGGTIVGVFQGMQKDLSGGNVLKFHLTHSKL